VYLLVSLFGPRSLHNMDKLLHRGPYAVAGESTATWADAATWMEKLGFSKDFTGRDKVVTYITVGWPLVWTLIFVVVTAYNLLFGVSAEAWTAYWHGWTWFILVCGSVVTVWFTIGGLKDMRYMYRRLRLYRDNPLDDGRVARPQNGGA
jgi:SSS family solute:Na+ symporter